MNNRKKTSVQKIIIFIAISVVAAFFIMLLHEVGHAVVAMSCGAGITGFSFTHVDWGDADFTEKQLAWLYLNGTLLPFVVSLPFFCLPIRRYKIPVRAVSFGMIIGGWVELYSWTVESFLLHDNYEVSWFLLFSGAGTSAVRIILVIICLIYTAAVCWKCGMIIAYSFFDIKNRSVRATSPLK